jgi:hypothetical protein
LISVLQREQEANMSRDHRSWEYWKRRIKCPGNPGSMLAWFRGISRPRDVGGEETTQRGTLVGPITLGELVV